MTGDFGLLGDLLVVALGAIACAIIWLRESFACFC